MGNATGTNAWNIVVVNSSSLRVILNFPDALPFTVQPFSKRTVTPFTYDGLCLKLHATFIDAATHQLQFNRVFRLLIRNSTLQLYENGDFTETLT